jgi:hypothetical protein
MNLKAGLLLFNLLCASDAVETHIVLTHGGRELTLPTQNPWVVDTIVVGQMVLADVVFPKWDKRHPKRTRILLGTLIALRTVAVVHNGIQVRIALR